MSFEDFQDGHRGGRLGYRNKTILAILNFYVTLRPPTTFQLNQTYGSRDVAVAILDIGMKNFLTFSNSKSPCRSNTSYQISAQSDIPFGTCCHLKIFKMATELAILGIEMKRF